MTVDRITKINKTYIKAFNDVFLYDFDELEDYRVLVTFLRISADMKHIRCYFRLIGVDDEQTLHNVRKFLKHNKGKIRFYLSKRIFSKYSPEIRFIVDEFDYDYD